MCVMVYIPTSQAVGHLKKKKKTLTGRSSDAVILYR